MFLNWYKSFKMRTFELNDDACMISDQVAIGQQVGQPVTSIVYHFTDVITANWLQVDTTTCSQHIVFIVSVKLGYELCVDVFDFGVESVPVGARAHTYRTDHRITARVVVILYRYFCHIQSLLLHQKSFMNGKKGNINYVFDHELVEGRFSIAHVNTD